MDEIIKALRAYQQANPIHNDSEAALFTQGSLALRNLLPLEQVRERLVTFLKEEVLEWSYVGANPKNGAEQILKLVGLGDKNG